MSERVPGRWKVHTVHDYSPQIVVADGELAGAPICDMFDERDHKALAGFVEGNAEFVAAAPETAAERDRLKALVGELVGLVEEAKDALNVFDSRMGRLIDIGEEPKHPWFRKAEKALTKAKERLNAQP